MKKEFLDDYMAAEEGKLRFRKISRLLVPYYRSRIWKRKICYCFECNSKFIGFVKNDADNQECIYCSGTTCYTRKGLVKAIEKEMMNSKFQMT